ncbi:MAG TPA: hypothetical protein VML95_08210, partial [Longimicrobiales bacterium]|nr:hypothetical protein [Longimicrobiales bacterium]
MRSNMKPILLAALFVGLVPGAVLAQEQDEVEVEVEVEEITGCTVEVDPAELPAGEAAIHALATLSENLGPLTGFEAPEESGIVIADAANIPRAEMANEGEEEVAPLPIELGAEANVFTVWLSTEEAVPGAFDVRFTTAEGYCGARINVVTAGETGDDGT